MVKRINPSQFDFYYGASAELIDFAKGLRKKMTPTEKIIWECLRNRSCGGLKFRRQHPIERFVADFYCHEKKLVIEIDGSIHNDSDRMEYDTARSFEFEKYGINVLRIKNEEVLFNLSNVLEKVKNIANQST